MYRYAHLRPGPGLPVVGRGSHHRDGPRWFVLIRPFLAPWVLHPARRKLDMYIRYIYRYGGGAHCSLCRTYGFTGWGGTWRALTGATRRTCTRCARLREKHNLSVMLTILLGDKSSWGYLLSQRPACYDYVALMLYNGGMYGPGGEGGACLWEGWAEAFLRQCPAVDPVDCSSKPNCENTEGAQKVLLGVITDARKGVCDATCASRAQALVQKYGGGGIMNWVLPGWGANSEPGGAARAFFCNMLPNMGVSAAVESTACQQFPSGESGGGGSGNGGMGNACGEDGDCKAGMSCQWWAAAPTTVNGPNGLSCSYGPLRNTHGCCINN